MTPDAGTSADMASMETTDTSVDEPDEGTPDDTGTVDPLAYPFPPQRWPAGEAITHDVDRDLDAVLEIDRLEGACQRWSEGEHDEETKLLCGKWMFFFQTFGTVGIPKVLLTFAQEWYVDYYGAGFSEFGFVPDPNSDEGMPVGLAPTTGMLGDLETRAFTCASCHFGQMADGRYAVGYGNMQLDYGHFFASLGAPLMMSLDENSSDVHPDIRAELLSYVQAAKEDPSYQLAVAEAGLQLLDAGDAGQTTVEEQGRFLALEPGTMDFLTKPLVDDGVWTVSRILSLWNIPDDAMRAEAEMDHEYLSWTGGAMNLDSFIAGFVAIGVADPDTWTGDRIAPLEAYIRSLRTPPLERATNDEAVQRGREVFEEAGCDECHVGPSGEGNRAFTFEEVGTDAEMAKIFNPDEDGNLCCGFGDTNQGGYVVTRGIKAPRIVGVENQTRWLHNGAVPSLESLFCLQPRPESSEPAQSAQGHEFGCDLEETQRRDLIEYLFSL
jgi:hypothetical protein